MILIYHFSYPDLFTDILSSSWDRQPNPEGDEEYQGFFIDRVEEINALGPRAYQQLFDSLQEEVFGLKRKEATEEQKRQKEFSYAQLQKIKVQAAREEGEGEGEGEKNYAGDRTGSDDQ